MDPVLPVLAQAGAVRRWRPSDTPETRISPAASSVPSFGMPNAPSRETRTGPPRKTTLLATASSANAAGSRCRPCAPSSATHRAADTPPSCGMLAPSSAVIVHRSQVGSDPSTSTTTSTATPACPAACHGSTTGWPYRSSSRASCGPTTASPTAKQPVAAPATAYEPVADATSHTRPSADIAIPARPTTAVRKKWAAPGRDSRNRY